MYRYLYVKRKKNEDLGVERLAQGHMTGIQSSEGQPRAFPFLTNILFSPMYFSKMPQHA